MKNKFGIVIWAFPFMGPYMCKLAKDAGLDGVQLELGNYEDNFFLTNKEVQGAFLEMKEKYGVEYPSLGINTFGDHGMVNDLNSKEGTIVLKAIDAAISAASALKIPKIMFPSFFAGEIKTKKDLENTTVFLKRACNLAKSENIVICTENTISIEDNKKLHRDVNENNFKLFFDTQNYALLKKYNPSEMILELRDIIVETHIKDGTGDMSNRLLGEGDSGFFNSMKTFKQINYGGWFIMENYYHKAPLNEKKESYFEQLKIDLSTAKKALAG